MHMAATAGGMTQQVEYINQFPGDSLVIGCGHKWSGDPSLIGTDHYHEDRHPREHFCIIDNQPHVDPDLVLDITDRGALARIGVTKKFKFILFENVPFDVFYAKKPNMHTSLRQFRDNPQQVDVGLLETLVEWKNDTFSNIQNLLQKDGILVVMVGYPFPAFAAQFDKLLIAKLGSYFPQCALPPPGLENSGGCMVFSRVPINDEAIQRLNPCAQEIVNSILRNGNYELDPPSTITSAHEAAESAPPPYVAPVSSSTSVNEDAEPAPAEDDPPPSFTPH